MAELGTQWAATIGAWDELCRIMDEEAPDWRDGRGTASRTYARLGELQWPVRRGNRWFASEDDARKAGEM